MPDSSEWVLGADSGGVSRWKHGGSGFSEVSWLLEQENVPDTQKITVR
jgi:hypothetical protein